MKIRNYFFTPTLLLLIFTISGCGEDPLTVDPNEQFSFEYNISGGIAGINETLTIKENDSVFYKSQVYDISTTINKDNRDALRRMIRENNFLKLNSEYLPNHLVADDIFSRFVFKSATKSKTIIASGFCDWPAELENIKQHLNSIIINFKKGVNSGKVTVRSISVLMQWQFNNKIRLEDYTGKSVKADEEIFNHFKENYRQKKRIVYFDQDWVYRIGDSGGYSFSFNELAFFNINVIDRKKPIKWLISTRLKNISEGGIIITGSEYEWLKEILENTYYPRFFIDDTLKSGEYVYEVSLLHGYFINTSQ